MLAQDRVKLLKKDILNLVYLASHFGLEEVANFWESVVKLNYWHQNRISRLIVKNLFGTVSDKNSDFSFAFKAILTILENLHLFKYVRTY